MEFDIQSNWIRPTTTLPPTGTRCIVTDGDVVVIATYISENSENCIWMLTGLNESDSKAFVVQGWMPLPRQIKKIVSYEEPKATTEEVKRDDSK